MGMLRRIKIMGLRGQFSLMTRLHVSRDPTLRILHYNTRNWGDAINPRFVRRLSGRPAVGIDIDVYNSLSAAARRRLAPVISVIGSIAGHADENTIIWGSGLQAPAILRGIPKEVRAVRGPSTRRELLNNGIDCPAIYGDPALLLPRIYAPQPRTPTFELGLIAHRNDANDPLVRRFAGDPRIKIINIKRTNWNFIDAILDCHRVVSSSLHGLVVADAYGVPAGWIEVSNRIPGGRFKFLDYHESIGADISIPLRLDSATTVDTLLDHCFRREPQLDLDTLAAASPFAIR